MRRWLTLRPGHHRHSDSDLRVLRGEDDGQIVWSVWSTDPQDGGVPLSGYLPTVWRARGLAEHLAAQRRLAA